MLLANIAVAQAEETATGRNRWHHQIHARYDACHMPSMTSVSLPLLDLSLPDFSA
jgi:hypothetical protein